MNEVPIPRHLDSQQQFLWWEFDEFVVAAGLFGVGIIIKQLLIALILIVLTSKAMRRFKSNNLDGAVQHVVYAAGVAPLNKAYQDGLEREFFA